MIPLERARFIASLGFALCAASASIAACAKRGEPTSAHKSVTAVPSGEVVDEKLLAYLSAARSLHHEADIFEDKNDVRGAIGTLERLLARPMPTKGPEVDEVVADTHARLGELRASLGDFDAAEKDVQLGLDAMPNISYFRGHLLEVRGIIEESRAKSLAAKGDSSGASKARDNAMKAYEDAIAVQDEVIKRGAHDGGAP